jgi:diketogulonate reductase-like aldo/keto reductase
MRSLAGVRTETIPQTRVLERDAVLRSFDDSLKRLRRDRIDFYCVHEPDQYFIDDDLFSVFDSLKANGRIFAHGLAWGRAAPFAPAQWDVVQAEYAPGYPRDGRLRFFHGIMRSSHSDAAAQLASAMRNDRDAVFIFSASERHQLTSLVRQVGRAPDSATPLLSR